MYLVGSTVLWRFLLVFRSMLDRASLLEGLERRVHLLRHEAHLRGRKKWCTLRFRARQTATISPFHEHGPVRTKNQQRAYKASCSQVGYRVVEEDMRI